MIKIIKKFKNSIEYKHFSIYSLSQIDTIKKDLTAFVE